MSPKPWVPPGLNQFAGLGMLLNTAQGPLLEEHAHWEPSYRIIASEYAGENLFDRLTDDVAYLKLEQEIEALRAIADLTNTWVLHQAGSFDLVRPEDRVYGYGAGLIMSAFAFPGRGSRFSDSSAGAYYAAREVETAIAETKYHAELALAGCGPCVTEKVLIEATLDGMFVDVRNGQACPTGIYDLSDYSAGQSFGSLVRNLEGYGILFTSVRNHSGECVAVFRPPVLSNAKAVQTLAYKWDGASVVSIQ